MSKSKPFCFPIIATVFVFAALFGQDSAQAQFGDVRVVNFSTTIVLQITGTAGPDLIEVRQLGSGDLRVVINGFDHGVISRTGHGAQNRPLNGSSVIASAGDDEVRFQVHVDLDARVSGGDGNDIIRTGAGVQSVAQQVETDLGGSCIRNVL